MKSESGSQPLPSGGGYKFCQECGTSTAQQTHVKMEEQAVVKTEESDIDKMRAKPRVGGAPVVNSYTNSIKHEPVTTMAPKHEFTMPPKTEVPVHHDALRMPPLLDEHARAAFGCSTKSQREASCS